MRKKIHVTKSKNGSWTVRNGLNSMSRKSFSAKKEAISAAKASGHQAGFLVIHNSDGNVSEVRRYKTEHPKGKVRVQTAPVKRNISKKDVFKSIAKAESKSTTQ